MSAASWVVVGALAIAFAYGCYTMYKHFVQGECSCGGCGACHCKPYDGKREGGPESSCHCGCQKK